MPNANNLNIGDHSYGFNGMEKDDEISGTGNSLDFGARMYNPRLGRWFATDPIHQSGESPYGYVNDNPIIYVDRNGEDNVIYLVALPSSTQFSKEDVQSVVRQANNNFRNLGLATRVVVFESSQPFDPAHLDPNDSCVLLGSLGEITSTVSGDGFSDNIKAKAGDLARSSVDPEYSATKLNKFKQGILIESSRVFNFGKETGVDKLGAAAFLIVHGAGHNAGINKHITDKNSPFDDADIMHKGTVLTSNYTDPLPSFLNPIENSFFTERLSDDDYFGNNEARDNYEFKGIPYKMGSVNPVSVNKAIGGVNVFKSAPKVVPKYKAYTGKFF